MSISIDRYVSIVSGVIGAQAVAQRELVGLRFTTDTRVPTDALVTVDKDGAPDYFGATSPEAVFANQYFAYISPAPASQARSLRFAAWADVARAARIYGADFAGSLTSLQAITTGYINLTLAGETHQVGPINLSAASSLANAASLIQTAIQAASVAAQWASATVTYDAIAGAFNLVSGATGNANISVAAANTGTDLGAALGWLNVLTIYSPGADAEEPVEALQRVENITDSFGSLSFGASITIAQAVAVAQYVAALNVKYQFYVSATPLTASDLSAALIAIPSTGVILNDTAGEYKEALPAAIMAATDYNRRNATVNYMYRQDIFTADVTSDQAANVYDPLRVNYYGQTASAGQRLSFFQRGFLMGGATAPLDMNVHANEQWLKAFLQARLLSLQLSLGKIPANNEGRGLIFAQVLEGVDRAKFNGTISVGKTLTTAQQLAITQLTGDADAWRDVQTNGYWLDVAIVEETGPSQITEYVALYTLAYAKNDVVRTVRGSHNLI